MAIGLPARRFTSELQSLLDKEVTVVTTTGKTYTGTLAGYSADTKDVCLVNAKSNEGEEYTKVIIYGHAIAYIYTREKFIDLKEFAQRLEKYFPRQVRYIEDARVIVVMDRIRVTEYGVEGEGPLADRIKRLYDEYLKEKGFTS